MYQKQFMQAFCLNNKRINDIQLSIFLKNSITQNWIILFITKKLMTIIMSFKQWKYYLENVSKIEVWLNHANFKWFMSQTVLNNHQVCWFIQLMSYDFTIQYCWDILNSADESSWKSDYIIMKQNKKYHKSIKKICESSFKQFWSTSRCVDSNLISKLIFWQIDDLMSTLVNKLATVMLETDRQYSCNIRETDSKAENLIWVLSLQATTQLKIRLAADDLVLYNKIFNSLSQKIMFSDIFISMKNLSILSLIKNIQEFNS